MNQVERTDAERWDAMTPAERDRLIRRDRSMRDPRWAALRARWAAASWAEMTPAQRAGAADLLGGAR